MGLTHSTHSLCPASPVVQSAPKEGTTCWTGKNIMIWLPAFVTLLAIYLGIYFSIGSHILTKNAGLTAAFAAGQSTESRQWASCHEFLAYFALLFFVHSKSFCISSAAFMKLLSPSSSRRLTPAASPPRRARPPSTIIAIFSIVLNLFLGFFICILTLTTW